jgi:hypothetical protein
LRAATVHDSGIPPPIMKAIVEIFAATPIFP